MNATLGRLKIPPPQESSGSHDLGEIRSQGKSLPPEVLFDDSTEMCELRGEGESTAAVKRNDGGLLETVRRQRERFTTASLLENIKYRVFRDSDFDCTTFFNLLVLARQFGFTFSKRFQYDRENRVIQKVKSLIQEIGSRSLEKIDEVELKKYWNHFAFFLDWLTSFEDPSQELHIFLTECHKLVDRE